MPASITPFATIAAGLAIAGLSPCLPGRRRLAPAAPHAYGAAKARVLSIAAATAARMLATLVIATAVTAAPALAQSLGDMAQEAGQDLETIPFFISVAFYIVGILLVGFGLIRLKRHVDHPGQTTIGSGIVAMLIGVALLGAPYVINSIGDTFGVDANATLSRPALD